MASSLSTSGTGTHYEDQVGAYFLCMLAAETGIVGLTNDTVTEVTLQREDLGTKFDDIIVSAGTAKVKRYAMQVKRTISPVRSDEDFQKMLLNAFDGTKDESLSDAHFVMVCSEIKSDPRTALGAC
jgi:hypothetical protein